MVVKREPVGPGQESVWDYPRPPALRPCTARVRVEHRGRTIADSTRSLCVLETSHPPVYMIPREDCHMDVLRENGKTTTCEFKGRASYFDLELGPVVPNAAWSYDEPSSRYAAIAGHLAFYASMVDACFVGDERVQAQQGDFYGGWITSAVKGPFKGGAGTWGW